MHPVNYEGHIRVTHILSTLQVILGWHVPYQLQDILGWHVPCKLCRSYRGDMYSVNLVGHIRVNIPKTVDTVKSDWFLMHVLCQLCRLYQGECWGEKVLTHITEATHALFLPQTGTCVCTRKGLDTHITYDPVLNAACAPFTSSNRLQISALKMCE